MLNISKVQSREEIDAVFNGEAPHDHPDEFWDTRMYEKRVFIAKHEGKSIGLLVYTIWWGNTPFLELIHIQDNFQRRGIAKKLLKEAILEIQSKAFKTLISSCEVDNKKSYLFHQKNWI